MLRARQRPRRFHDPGRTAWLFAGNNLANRRRNAELRWRNQDRIPLHRLRSNNIWKKSQGRDCGKKRFGSGVPHTHPTRSSDRDIVLSFVAERKLLPRFYRAISVFG